MKIITISNRDFLVSEQGEVWSTDYTCSYGRKIKGQKLKPDVGIKNNYHYVSISGNGKTKKMLVHRLIAKAFISEFSENLDVDHIDGNRGNNELSNLRMATRSENHQGRRVVNGFSKYRGVTFDKKNNKWRAKAVCNGRHFCGGRHATEDLAAKAYNKLVSCLGFKNEAFNEI